MNRLFWQAILVAPVLFAASLFSTNSASAQTITADKEAVNQTLEQINNYQQLEQSNQSQVTNVNQLRDVSPTDWAYEALRSLVDRYGCISGFPNQTYRGSQPLSRYEFAAGLNSCLNQIERLIASQESVGSEDLDTITRLTQEFEAELATLGGRVDEIESRTAVLEDSQFSTTTKLKGEGIFAISDVFGGGTDFDDSAPDLDGDDDISDEEVDAFALAQGGDTNGDGNIDDDELDAARDAFEDDTEIGDNAETTFSSRVRLNFDTSFTGEDRLRTRLEGGNVVEFDEINGSTNSARLGFDTNNDFDIEVSDLHYRFPVNDKVRAWVGAQGLDLDDIFAVTNPMLESSGTGALSRFSRRNPLLFRGTEGAGAGLNIDLIEDRVGINVGYLTDNAFDPQGAGVQTVTVTDDDGNEIEQQVDVPAEGLFSGSFSAGAQLEFSPIESLELSATYIRNYQTGGVFSEDDGEFEGGVNLAGSTVSGNAGDPFGNDGEVATTANKIGLGANLNVGERIVLAGFGGYADVEGLVDNAENPSGEIWTWGANVSFLDLGKEGSVLSLAGGMLPKFISDVGAPEIANGVEEDPDTSYLVEALYKFPLNDNILITPGAYAVFNPDHITENDTIYVGVLRTTFEF